MTTSPPCPATRVSPCEEERCFFVTLYYREPAYERRRGRRRAPYQGTVQVLAASAAQAEVRARAWFRDMEIRSAVGWLREIERIEVAEVA